MNTCENFDQSRPLILKSGVKVKIGKIYLKGELSLSENSKNIILIVQQNSANSYESYNQHIANSLYAAGMSTLMIDLLTDGEQKIDSQLYSFRFDHKLLGQRLIQVTNWVQQHPILRSSKIIYFGTGIDVAPALLAVTTLNNQINAVITNEGRLDLVENLLAKVKCPVLLIVSDSCKVILRLNKLAYKHMRCEKDIRLLSTQSNNFNEFSKLEEMTQIISKWLHKHHINEITWN